MFLVLSNRKDNYKKLKIYKYNIYKKYNISELNSIQFSAFIDFTVMVCILSEGIHIFLSTDPHFNPRHGFVLCTVNVEYICNANYVK